MPSPNLPDPVSSIVFDPHALVHEREYRLEHEGEVWPFSIRIAARGRRLRIPDPGGQMDGVPRYPDQLAWLFEHIQTADEAPLLEPAWGTVWTFDRTATRTLLSLLETAGRLVVASVAGKTADTSARAWGTAMLDHAPTRLLADFDCTMLYYSFTLAIPLPLASSSPIEHECTLSAWEDDTTVTVTLSPPAEHGDPCSVSAAAAAPSQHPSRALSPISRDLWSWYRDQFKAVGLSDDWPDHPQRGSRSLSTTLPIEHFDTIVHWLHAQSRKSGWLRSFAFYFHCLPRPL